MSVPGTQPRAWPDQRGLLSAGLPALPETGVWTDRLSRCPGAICKGLGGVVMGRDGCLVTKNLEGAHLAEIQTRNLRGCLPRVAGGSPSHEVSGPAFSTQDTGA